MYISKTIKRIEKLKNNNKFSYYFDNPILINGIKYNSLNNIINKCVSLIKKKLLNIDSLCIIHGDLCFANMLIDDNYSHIKLIDPRGKFGSFDIYGDQRYELAKLYHSVDGKYDLIIKDMFVLENNNYEFKYKMIEKKRDYDVFELMKEEFTDVIGNHNDEIEIIESLLFLSMIPLHSENLSHQYMMLIKGIEILSRHLDTKEQ